ATHTSYVERQLARVLDNAGTLRESMERYAAYPSAGVLLAHMQWYMGRTEEARAGVRGIGSRVDTVPRDSEWLPTMCYLVEAASALDEIGSVTAVYEALAPYTGLFAVDGIGAALLGSVDRHLGTVASAL